MHESTQFSYFFSQNQRLLLKLTSLVLTKRRCYVVIATRNVPVVLKQEVRNYSCFKCGRGFIWRLEHGWLKYHPFIAVSIQLTLPSTGGGAGTCSKATWLGKPWTGESQSWQRQRQGQSHSHLQVTFRGRGLLVKCFWGGCRKWSIMAEGGRWQWWWIHGAWHWLLRTNFIDNRVCYVILYF